MKNTIKHILSILAVGLFTLSCDYDESGYDSVIGEIDPNATYYIQFKNASKTLETSVTEDGDLIDIETSIVVALVGVPQSQDIVVNLEVDPSSTIASNMFELSANSITIPAGSTSGSIMIRTNTEAMPVAEELLLNMNIDAGEHSATAGTTLSYKLSRIAFCPLTDGATDFVGTWTGSDGQGDDYTYSSTLTLSDATSNSITVSGINTSWIVGFWGEPIIEGGSFTMEVAGNGVVNIPQQYIYTTTYQGDSYRYEIKGSGKWENCDDNPKLIINYDIYYEGETTGLAQMYKSYFNNIPYLTATVTKN